MPLIKNGNAVPHSWHMAQEGNPLPPGDIVVTLPELLAGEATWALRPGRLGVAVDADTQVATLVPRFDQLSLIVLDFSAFTDGRGFSLARRLRGRGYRSGLWARGPLIADQYGFAIGCGFDAVLLDEAAFARQGANAWAAAAQSLSLSYQPGGSGRPGGFGQPRSILALRQARRFGVAAE